VPAKVTVPEDVTGPPLVVSPVVPPLTSTLVTVPAPAGVAQAPSPRQKVDADALVQLPKLVTGKLPVTLVAKLTKVVDVVPVPPLAIGKVPVTPVVNGKPVTLVITPDAGVPSAGVVNAVLAVIDAVFILLRGIVFSQRNCYYLLFITSISVQSHGDTQN
jgi:hypothetical protein